MRVEMPKKMNFKLDVEGEGPLTDRHTAEFLANEHFDEIYIRRQKLFSVADAKKLRQFDLYSIFQFGAIPLVLLFAI
ncbi:hypothetical protein DBIPINDM_006720 [Mesorhizobium sp. AR02]|uniref:hypothetical protein n=1 Tax=Mesorhizobium sp. AR02 TaxID=2865837 RepID=UPI0021604A5F|nr:hypothetical protein [Mesorhizobium sp. AR02]UVK53247.1 hypothetical protein DBIPINDM_006720 [Mesorhizobium sp. AR02]